MKKRNIITESSLLLMSLTLLGSTATHVFAANTSNDAKSTQEKEKSIPSNPLILVRDPEIGPGYYDQMTIQNFNSILHPSPFLSLYTSLQNQAFLNKIKPYVLALKSRGILPSIAAAQAAVESYWGQSGLTRSANNLFGVKGSYHGQSVIMSTQEEGPYGRYTINAAFRKYPSWEASIQDYANTICTNFRYTLPQTNYRKVAAQLTGTYASASNYGSALIATIEANGLAAWDHEAGGSAVASTPVGTVPEPEQIAQIVYKPGYGVLAFQNTGKSIAGSNYKFKDGTRWKVVNTKVINGEEMYLVGNNTYIPKKYTSHYDNGIITIHYQPNYGVNALHADGTQVQGSNKVFKTGTRWNVKYTRVINGEICYLVGNDEYIPKKYTQWGKGE